MKGDAIELVRRLNPGWTFPEAVAYATGQPASLGWSLEILETRPAAGPARPADPARPGRWEPAGRADRVCPWPMPWRWSMRPP